MRDILKLYNYKMTTYSGEHFLVYHLINLLFGYSLSEIHDNAETI